MRKPLDSFAISTMVVLCILWGMQTVAVKAAAPDMGSVLQLGLRSVVAALLVWGLVLVRRQRIVLNDGTLLPGIGAGVLFAAEFLCIALGLRFTSASHMSVFLYTAPIFTVLGLHWFVPGERLRSWQWAGVLAAFSGIAVAFSNGFAEGFTAGGRDPLMVLAGDALGVLAGLFWAATTLLIRRSALAEAPPATTLMYQLCGCGAILLVVSVLIGEPQQARLTELVWISLLFQSVIVGFISYLVWFWMLRTYLASRLSVFSFLTPLFGVAFGVLLLHEALDPRFVAGAVLVLAGVVLVNLRRV